MSNELTTVGLTQAFGVFQAEYARTQAVQDGIVRVEQIDDRALISAIGSLGNGGIVAAFAVLYYPHLPQLGMYVRYLCSFGTACIVLGLTTATASHSVSTRSSDDEFCADKKLGLAPVRYPGPPGGYRSWYFALCPGTDPSRILPR